MRIAAVFLVVIASCGGGERRAVPSTPQRDDSATARSVTVSSLPPAGSSAPGDDDPIYGGHDSGPAFSSEPLPVAMEQPPAQGCDPAPYADAGHEALDSGQFAQALAAYEKAIVCVHDAKFERLAVVAACKAKLYARARAHFVRVRADDKMRDTLIQICQGPHFIAL